MIIPNREVKSIYKNTIMQWFDEKVKTHGTTELFDAIISEGQLVNARQNGTAHRFIVYIHKVFLPAFSGFIISVTAPGELYSNFSIFPFRRQNY